MRNYLITRNNNETEKDLIDTILSFPFNFETSETSKLMATDMIENEDSYLFLIDLPNVKKENIELHYENNYLKVNVKAEEPTNKLNYLLKERMSGNFSRTYYVGDDVCEDGIDATFENGTLKINVKKIVKEETKKVISIK